jgi:chromosome segregation ATPase
MNDKKSSFPTYGMPKAILTISGCVLIVALLSSGLYFSQILHTQQLETASLFKQIKEQELRMIVLIPSVEELKTSLEETKAQGAIQKKTQDHLGMAITALETAHASLTTDTRKMKAAEKEWMKDSLISLGNLEEKINETTAKTLSLESEAADSNKDIKLLKEQVTSLNALLNKIEETIPISSSTKERVQRMAHPKL